MKKHFLFALLFALIGGMSIQAQNINSYLAPLDELQTPTDQWTYTFINSIGQVMFDGEILSPDALQQPIEKVMKRKGNFYFVVISALPKEHEVFQTVVKQHIAAAKALNKKPFKVYYSTELPPPPFPPQVEVIEVIENEPEIEEIEVVDTSIEGEDAIYMVVEKMPEFPGGMEAMWKFLSDHLNYPEEAREKNIEGRSIIQFIVEKDGTISNIEVVRSAGDKSLDKEAVRVIKLMPKWKPGSQRDKIVRCKYTAPVTFKLKNIVPLNSESFKMEYDVDKWTMEPVSAPDMYLFTYKPFYEMVSIQFMKGDTTDAKQFIREQVIGKANEYFADATVTDNIGQSTLFGAPVYLTVYLSPWGEQTYKGMVMTSNTHGGFFLVVTASANYDNSEALQLIKTIRFKQ